jgi:hypothetical protein
MMFGLMSKGDFSSVRREIYGDGPSIMTIEVTEDRKREANDLENEMITQSAEEHHRRRKTLAR